MKYYQPLIIILLALISCSDQKAATIDNLETYHLGETEPAVQGKFLRFFKIYGGVERLGHPLTGEIVVDGWTVQYFERGRLEYHPENEPAYHITVGWLGDLLHRRRPPIPVTDIPPNTDSNRRYFPQTGHTVSGDFLHYFNTNGRSVQFGLPISEPFLSEGRLTQDFQSARFFWTPELETPVTLEEIGRVHLDTIEMNKILLEPGED